MTESRTPVLFVVDGVLAQMIETVIYDSLDEIVSSYDTRAYSFTGAAGRKKRALITGSYAHADGEKMVKSLMSKAQKMRESEQLWEEYGTEDAEVVVTAFGLPGRVCREIVQERRKKGEKVGFIRPITLFPFPESPFLNLPESVRNILVVEMNYGQMIEDVRLVMNGRCGVSHYGHVGGDQPMVKAKEIKKRLDELVAVSVLDNERGYSPVSG